MENADNETATNGSQHQDKLLQEYGLAQEYALTIHEHVWQIGSILIAASLGVFGVVVSREQTTFGVALFAGFFSSTLIWIWYAMMCRYSSFVQVSYYRMREIEEELGMWRNRYIHFLDNLGTAAAEPASDERLTKLMGKPVGRDFYRRVNVSGLGGYLAVLITGMWIIYLIYQAVLTWSS